MIQRPSTVPWGTPDTTGTCQYLQPNGISCLGHSEVSHRSLVSSANTDTTTLCWHCLLYSIFTKSWAAAEKLTFTVGWVGLLEKWRIRLRSASARLIQGLWLIFLEFGSEQSFKCMKFQVLKKFKRFMLQTFFGPKMLKILESNPEQGPILGLYYTYCDSCRQDEGCREKFCSTLCQNMI